MKFAGNYHGHSDALLADARQRRGPDRGRRQGGACPARPASPPARWPTPWSRRTTSCPSSTTPSPASSSSPSPPTWAWSPPAPGFLAGLRAECDRVGALLIFDEVITGFRLGTGRGPGALRRHARPIVLRQGHRRWPQRRRLRRPGRGHGPAGPAGPRLPGRHAVGEPPRHRRRAGRARPCSTTTPTSGCEATAARLGAGLQARPRRAPGSPAAGARSRARSSASSSATEPPARLRRRPRAPTPRTYAALFHALLDRGVALAPGALRGHVPGPGPRRRRGRRDRRPRRRGGRRRRRRRRRR